MKGNLAFLSLSLGNYGFSLSVAVIAVVVKIEEERTGKSVDAIY